MRIRDLVLRARSGDRQALEDLVQRHQTWIYTITVRMLYHPQDAEDVAQEIIIKYSPGSRRLRAGAALRTWLYRIVVNHVLSTKTAGGWSLRPWILLPYGAAIEDTPELELADPKGHIGGHRRVSDRGDALLHLRNASLHLVVNNV